MLNNYVYYHRQVAFCAAVYYRYYQRSRLPKPIVKQLRKREGVLSPPRIRYYVLHQFNIWNRKSLVSRNIGTRSVFPEPGLRGYYPEARKS